MAGKPRTDRQMDRRMGMIKLSEFGAMNYETNEIQVKILKLRKF